jgi:hypothetical protein
MGEPTGDPVAAAGQLVVLSFELLDSEMEELPKQLVEVFKRPDVAKAVQKTLLDFAKGRDKSATTALSDEDIKKLQASVIDSAKTAATDVVLSQIKASPKYTALMSQVTNFEKALKSSSLGVWVDNNKKILYVVGATLIVSGGAALFVTKTGGPIVDTITNELSKHKFDVLHVGVFTLSVSNIDFKPSAQVLGAKITGNLKWDRVSVDLKLQVLGSVDELSKVNGEAAAKVGSVTFSGYVNKDMTKPTIDLGIKMGAKVDKVNLSLGAYVTDGAPRATGSVGFQLSKDASLKFDGSAGRTGNDKPNEYRGMVTLEWSL